MGIVRLPTNRLTRLITPALTTSPTTGSAPLTAIPLAIDGGGSMLTGGGNFIVVLVAGAGATPPQIRAYAGGAPTGIPITFPITMGTPVGVHTSSIGDIEYAWVSTIAPNTIQRYKLAGTGISHMTTLMLPQEPIDFIVASGSDDIEFYDPADPADPLGSRPFLHVLMR